MDLYRPHVFEFSPCKKYFALINEQGILKIWDTETNELKREFKPNLHLTVPYTTLKWIPVSHPSNEKSKKNRKSFDNVSNVQLYIALGSMSGRVCLYSYASGKIDYNFEGDGHTGKINDLTYDGSKYLYSCGDDCKVISWDINKELAIESWKVDSEKLQAIMYCTQSKNLLLASRQLKIFSINEKTILQTFTGHTSEVLLLDYFFYNGIEYVISSSKLERILSLWIFGNNQTNTSCTFLMEDVAHNISSSVDENGNLTVASVTRSGVIHIYIQHLESLKVGKPIKPKLTIKIASDNDNIITPIPAIVAVIGYKLNETVINFGYGDKHSIIFEELRPDFSQKQEVLVRTDPKVMALKNAKKTPDNFKHITPVIDTNNVEYTSASTSKKKQKTVEIPMESRLQNLNLNNDGMPNAQSKVQLLIQALHSKDANLLNTVLTCNEPEVIKLTLQKLPTQYVGSLVDELTSLMHKKRVNVQIALSWLKVLLQTHSSQLMALGPDDLTEKFGSCLGIIEHRVKALKDLSKLKGRMELLVSQIKRNAEEDCLTNENLLVYEDNESSNSDLEEESADDKSLSGSEWTEEDSDDEQDVSMNE